MFSVLRYWLQDYNHFVGRKKSKATVMVSKRMRNCATVALFRSKDYEFESSHDSYKWLCPTVETLYNVHWLNSPLVPLFSCFQCFYVLLHPHNNFLDSKICTSQGEKLEAWAHDFCIGTHDKWHSTRFWVTHIQVYLLSVGLFLILEWCSRRTWLTNASSYNNCWAVLILFIDRVHFFNVHELIIWLVWKICKRNVQSMFNNTRYVVFQGYVWTGTILYNI